jgi:hypothetical protein
MSLPNSTRHHVDMLPSDGVGDNGKGKFDANSGIKLFWDRIKFVAYPEAVVCMHESHALVMLYYGIKLEVTEGAGHFMRMYLKLSR